MMQSKNSTKSLTHREVTNKPLSSGAIYYFSQLWENKNTYPGIIFNTDDFKNKDLLMKELIEQGYLDGEEITEDGMELMNGLDNMQNAEYVLVLNEFSYFFDAKSLTTTRIITRDDKHTLYYRYKTTDIVVSLLGMEFLKTTMSKQNEIIISQYISEKAIVDKYNDKKTCSIQIYRNGALIYNELVIEQDDSVLVYDPITKHIVEKAGQDVFNNIIEILQLGVEFNLIKYKPEIEEGF